MQDSSTTRRQVLRTAAAFTAVSYSRVMGANDRINLALIGAGERGFGVLGAFLATNQVELTAVADIYAPKIDRVQTKSPNAKGYSDHRKLLEQKNIDAVQIATPDHWHSAIAIDALNAGKDVYVEKPLCQTPEQGVELVAAEKRTRQIVQVGMQRRSYDLYIEGRKAVASGVLGNVRTVRSWWLNNYLGGPGPAQAKLDGPLDWEQWQGPAAKHAMDPFRFRNWRQFSDYAGGIVADQGAHVYDGIHFLMNASYPVAVNASANKPHREGFDTPESVVVIAEYPEDFLGIFTVNYAAMRYKSRNDQLNQLDGDKARMDIGREDFKVYSQGNEDTPILQKASVSGFGKATDEHVNNFLDCVRTRQEPTAPMRLGFQAALVVQLANLSLRNARRMRWNMAAGRVE